MPALPVRAAGRLSSVGRRRYGALSVTARGEGAVESQVSGQAYRSELRLEFDQPAAPPRAELADIVFVLTTNRADLLEPALAARPGRVDQAVELRLPDAAARRALFELYRGSLEVDTSDVDAVLEWTDGVTASFLKELLRRAALPAAQRSQDGPLSVSTGDLGRALDELLDTRNAMTRTLLGSSGARGAEPG